MTNLLNALRLRISPSARVALEALSNSLGPLELVHHLLGDARGTVTWGMEGRTRRSGLVEWARAGTVTLLVHASDVPELQGVQLVLDAESPPGGGYNDRDTLRFVTLYRPHTESEQEILGYVLRREAYNETAGLLSRLVQAR
jgi:hypothetical protein